MPGPSSIVRIGPDNHSAYILRSAILSHFKAGDDSNALFLQNRYFTAHVELKGILADDNHANDTNKEDGILLVFDENTGSSSFESLLGPIHDQVVASGGGELLRLCVAIVMESSARGGKEYEEEYSKRVMWCLDRGYEYVEADLSEQGLARGHDERDKEGFARIVEAIEGTVWSSAVMMEPSRKNALLKEALGQEDTTKPNTELTSASVVVPDLTNASLANEDDPQIAVAEKEAADIVKSNASANYLDDGDVSPAELQKRKEESEQELLLESFEGALRQASRIREASRSGTLSDDERKQRAGDAAMLLMTLMNQMGYDEDGDDEHDGDDSSIEDMESPPS